MVQNYNAKTAQTMTYIRFLYTIAVVKCEEINLIF